MNGYNDPNQDDDDERVSPAFEGFINVMLVNAGLAIVALSIWGLLKW
jgi:hypothetical protein